MFYTLTLFIMACKKTVSVIHLHLHSHCFYTSKICLHRLILTLRSLIWIWTIYTYQVYKKKLKPIYTYTECKSWTIYTHNTDPNKRVPAQVTKASNCDTANCKPSQPFIYFLANFHTVVTKQNTMQFVQRF